MKACHVACFCDRMFFASPLVFLFAFLIITHNHRLLILYELMFPFLLIAVVAELFQWADTSNSVSGHNLPINWWFLCVSC